MRVEDLLEKLEGVREAGPNKWMALCPAHDDHNPSLSISVKDQKILLHCHAKCSIERICAKLGIEVKDLFLDAGEKREHVATYDYVDENGNLLFQVLRYEPKDFRQRRPDGTGGFVYNLQGVRRVLYRLPEVLEAEQVWVVEGEKDADNLAKLGLTATTAPGGAGKWLPEYSEALAEKDVIILPDNDPQGKEHAQRVARALYSKARSIKILELPDLPPKGDVSDWLAQGGTLDKLTQLAAQTPPWAPPPEPKPELSGIKGTYIYRHPRHNLEISLRSVRLHSDGRLTGELRIRSAAGEGIRILGGSGVVNLAAPRSREQLARLLEEEHPIGVWSAVLADLYERVAEAERAGMPWLTLGAEEPPPPRGWLCRPLLPQGVTTIIYGPGGAAKSLLGMTVGLLVSCGEGRAGRLSTQIQGTVLYLDWEDHPDEARRRLWRLSQGLELPAAKVVYRKCITPLAEDLETIKEAVLEFDAALVIVDSLLPAAGAADNRDPAGTAQRLFEALRQLDTTSLVIAHHGKDKERGIYGSIFFRWLARNVWRVEPYSEAGEDSLLVTLFHEKSNFSRLEKPWGLEFRFDGEEGPIRVLHSDPTDNPNAQQDIPPKDRILDLLLSEGRLTEKEIVEGTGIPRGTVASYLRRLEREGRVRKRGRGLWEAVAETPPGPETKIESGEDPDEEIPF